MSQPTIATSQFKFNKPIKGELGEHALSWILLEADAAHATGMLTLTRNKVQKVIYLREGTPIFVDSNLRNETLGNFLVAKGLITDEQLTQALNLARSTRKKLGEALVELTFLTEEAVEAMLREQVQLKIVSALRWAEGSYAFEPNKKCLGTVPAYPTGSIELILSTAKWRFNAEQVRDQFRERLSQAPRLTELGNHYAEILVARCGASLLQPLAEGRASLQRLVEASADGATALVYLAALHQAGLIQFQESNIETASPSSEKLATPIETPFATPVIQRDPLSPTIDDSIEPNADAESLESNLERLDWLHSANHDVAQPETGVLQLPVGAETTEPIDGAAMSAIQIDEADLPALDLPDLGISNVRFDNSSTVDSLGAELVFQKGQEFLRQQDPQSALDAFDRAIALSPGQSDHHAYRGWALYHLHGKGERGANAAHDSMTTALSLAPDSALAHELMAYLEQELGHYAQAVEHYARALETAPTKNELFQPLKALLRHLENLPRLESEYRKALFRLRNTTIDRVVPLWIELAYLYRELGQPDNVEKTLSVINSLAPHDPQVKATHAALTRHNASPEALTASSEQMEEGYRRRFLADPTLDEPLQQLYRLYEQTGQTAKKATVTALLVHRQRAEPAVTHTFHSARAQYLASITRDEAVIRTLQALEQSEALRDPEDHPLLDALLGELAPLIRQLYPIGDLLASSGIALTQCPTIALVDAPQNLREIVETVTTQLQCEPPNLCLLEKCDDQRFRYQAFPIPHTTPALLCDRRLLDEKPQSPLLRFALIRALTTLQSGRAHAFLQPVAHLKTAVMAALTHHQPSLKLPDPDGQVARFRAALTMSRIDLATITQLAQDLLNSGGQLNLSEWVRAVKRTSATIALVASGDLYSALQLLATDEKTYHAIVAYALSDETL